MSEFDRDPYPGRPKILFIGWSHSTHTHSWMELLRSAAFNVRMFALPMGEPPTDWWVPCYVTAPEAPAYNDKRRRTVLPSPEVSTPEEALAKVIQDWRPDIVHTLGIDRASFLYRSFKTLYPDLKVAKWVVQARGGSDTALSRFDPPAQAVLEDIFSKCDHFIADNQENYEYAVKSGLAPTKVCDPEMGPVPGTGGFDLEALSKRWTLPPSKRERLIIWPKAYETPWAKANPVFEGILNAWDAIKPCRIEMLWMDDPNIQMWYHRLFSEELRESCVARQRLSHQETLDLFARARVMLAPSLIDGVPNSMMEAMALGAAPIVSPIETITPVVRHEENVLFARNLYPNEIADALVRAMTDDALVDRMAANNVAHVHKLADRRVIRKRALDYYEEVARQARAQTSGLADGRNTVATTDFYFRSNETAARTAPDGSDVGDRLNMKLDGSGTAWIGATGDSSESQRVAFGFTGAPETGMIEALHLRTAGSTRVEVDHRGRVGIGVESASCKLDVNGTIAAAGGHTQLADARLQCEVAQIANPLGTVQALTGVRFRWGGQHSRTVGQDIDVPTATPQLGFVAQQLEEVLPEAVTQAENGLRYVQVSHIVALLVEAVKSQSAKIEDLNRSLAELRARGS